MFMPWGKYKGWLLKDLAEDHTDYLFWVLNQDWLKPILKAQIEMVLAQRENAKTTQIKNIPYSTQFTKEEIKWLLIKSHPDRNLNDEIALNITRKLITMKKEI